jgi:hypothetical protein
MTMKIVRREETWIHTHFVTNCTYLPADEARKIRRSMNRLLDRLGIVFGLHFESGDEGGLRIVLECIPLPEAMEEIESHLSDVVKPIPARPRRTRVEIDPPQGRVITGRR